MPQRADGQGVEVSPKGDDLRSRVQQYATMETLPSGPSEIIQSLEVLAVKRRPGTSGPPRAVATAAGRMASAVLSRLFLTTLVSGFVATSSENVRRKRPFPPLDLKSPFMHRKAPVERRLS